MIRQIAFLCAAMAAAGIWAGDAGAVPVAGDATLVPIVTPISGFYMAAGLASDVSPDSTIDFSDPFALVVGNAAGTSFKLQVQIETDGLDFIQPVSYIVNGPTIVGVGLPFGYGGEAYRLEAVIAPIIDLTIINVTYPVVSDWILLTFNCAYGADPASFVTLRLLDSAGEPLALAAVPEPASIVLLAAGLLALSRLRPRTIAESRTGAAADGAC